MSSCCHMFLPRSTHLVQCAAEAARVQVWDMAWVRRTVHDAAYGGDMRAAWQLWTWLQREAWGLIPGVPFARHQGLPPEAERLPTSAFPTLPRSG